MILKSIQNEALPIKNTNKYDKCLPLHNLII